jgi:hypothetical protein
MFNLNQRFSVTGSNLRSTPTRELSGNPVAKSRHQEMSSVFGGAGQLGSPGNSSMGVYGSGPLNSVSLLNGLVPEQEDYLRRYYRDIYYLDAVAGTTVDMMSAFPFSDYTLTGCENNILEKYAESLSRLNIRSLMPEISTAYLVDGSSISSLIFNTREKLFIDLVMFSVDNCTINQLPFYSTDPEIIVKNTEAMVRFMKSNDKQAMALKALLPADLIRTFSQSAFKLDPLTTLYISRKTLPGSEPISFLKRVLPIYLLEKTLFRGTLVEANKRQRSMLHITMGDDTHTFTPEEMAETVNQFQLADLDPLGAVIGTRNTVAATEIRQGGDFWKWSDTIDIMTPYKLRALGISEAFLSGDATLSNTETALSVFLENLDAYRSFLTYETFTNKIFPIVAVSNDFFKKGKEVDTKRRTQLQYQLNNHRDLEIPILHWHKRLEAKDEENILDTLSTLQEKGFTIPMRMWAAAAKVDMNAYYHDLQQDEEVRKLIAKYSGQPEQPSGGAGGNEDMGDDEEMEFASIHNMSQPVRRQNLLNRSMQQHGSEIKGQTKTGKDKYILNQRQANATANRRIAQAIIELEKPEVRSEALKRVRASLGSVPNIIGLPIDNAMREQKRAMAKAKATERKGKRHVEGSV